MVIITVFFVAALGLGGLAYRLSLGPLQIPWITSRLASAVSGQGVDISITRAALAWGGYKAGGGVPLYLALGDIVARNSAGVELARIPAARLVFLPGALIGTQAPILVTSSDALFAGSDVKVSLRAAIRLGFFHLSQAALNFTLGAGRLGAGRMQLPISGGGFNLDVTPDSVDVQNGHLALARVDGNATNVSFSGQGLLQGRWQGSVHVAADAMQADALGQYWPAGLVVQTRNWVTRNITGGTASDAKFTFDLSAPADLTAIELDNASGHFNGTDLSVGWIPHAAPITGVSGVFTLDDSDTINISASAGSLGGVALHDGHLKITGVSQPDQMAVLDVPVSGSVAAVIAVLNAAPLNLLKLAPPSLLQASGAVTGMVAADFPLKNDLQLAQVDLNVTAHVSAAAAPTPLAGVNFSAGSVDLTATTQELRAQGNAILDGEAATGSIKVMFGPGQPVIKANLQSVAGAALLGQFGLQGGGVSGAVPLSLQIDQDATGRASFVVDADLTPAALRLNALGWAKKAGDAGKFEANAVMAPDGKVSIAGIAAQAPGLAIMAKPVAGQNMTLHFSRLLIGNSDATGDVRLPLAGQGWRVDLSGPVLDVSALMKQVDAGVKGGVKGGMKGDGTAKPPAPAATTPTSTKTAATSGPPWQATLRFNRLVLTASPAPVLQNFTFSGDGQASQVFNATASTGSNDGQSVNVKLTRSAAGEEKLHLDTADGGNLLRALGLFGNLQGGGTRLDASYTEQSAVGGIVKIEGFRVLNAPVIGKILQGMTLYGVADATSGPGLVFDRLVAPFSLGQSVLRLDGARAFSSSLGFTTSGRIGLGDGTMDLDTTIVPAYLLNAAPGKIPLIGKLFSAETGGGLFAMRAKISGTISDPKVSVNPLSAFTPGVLRDMFGIGESKPVN